MRVVDLFESESENPSVVAKALHKEFAAMAKEYGLVLQGGMGWPRVSQKGLWTGGGIAAGSQKVDDAVKDIKYEQRVNAFLIDASAKIEQLLDDGRAVLIGKGVSSDMKTAVPAVKGRVFNQLKDSIQTSKPPGAAFGKEVPSVVWFIPHPPHLLGMKTLTGSVVDGTASIHKDKRTAAEGGGMSFHLSMPAKEARALEKLSDEYRDISYRAYRESKTDPETDAAMHRRKAQLATDLYAVAGHKVQVTYVPGGSSHFFNLGPGFPRKNSIPLPADKIVDLLQACVSDLRKLEKQRAKK